MDTPTWDPTHLMFAMDTAPIRSWSAARVKKAANVLQINRITIIIYNYMIFELKISNIL